MDRLQLYYFMLHCAGLITSVSDIAHDAFCTSGSHFLSYSCNHDYGHLENDNDAAKSESRSLSELLKISFPAFVKLWTRTTAERISEQQIQGQKQANKIAFVPR